MHSQHLTGRHVSNMVQNGAAPRFPQAIVTETSFDEDTGIIRIKRDHPWVKAYKKWISMMMCANHDCQFLFTKNHTMS